MLSPSIFQSPWGEAKLQHPATTSWLITSKLLQANGANFEKEDGRIWKLIYKLQAYLVTFRPAVFDEHPSLRLMTFGDPLFESLLSAVLA